MTEDEERKAEVLGAIKSLFPGFDSESSGYCIERAIQHDAYADYFPEDMIEERLDWDDLYGMFNDMTNAFNTLVDLIVEEVKRRREDVQED